MITLRVKIGKSVLEYQAEDMKKVHAFSSVYAALPDKCDVCGSEDVFLSWKNPKENDYYTINCKKCGAELALHQRKTGGFYIVAGEKMEVYNPEAPKEEKKKSDDSGVF